MISQICVDMDGVLCDFVGPALKLFNTDLDTLIKSGRWPAGEYKTSVAIGCTEAEIWERIDQGGHEYWANLPPHDWHRDLLAMCRGIAPTIVLTSPNRKPESVQGKLIWLQKHYGGYVFRDFLIGPRKHFCARPGAVLIDDSDVNCEAFIEAGGHAIVFPRHWNSNYRRIEYPITYVTERLNELQES